MANDNSIVRFTNASPKEIQETIGITNFEGSSGTEWNQTIGGLIFQGGVISDPGGNGGQAVFSIPFPKQVLFVTAFPFNSTGEHNVSGASITLTGFRINNNHGGAVNYYWFAIGV